MEKWSITITADNTDEVKKEVARRAKIFLKEVGIHISGEAQLALESNPRRVDTGLLRNSITYALSGEPTAIKSYHASYISEKGRGQKKDATSAESGSAGFGVYTGKAPEEPNENRKAVYVGTNVSYAAYVHDGTSGAMHMQPNRYLKNAFEWNTEQIKQKMKQAYEGMH